MLLTRRPRTGEALREARAGLAAERDGSREAARFRGWIALSRILEGDVEGAVHDAEAVLPTVDDAFARSLALDTLALAAGASGHFVEAAELIDESARAVEALGTREAYDACPHMILGLALMRVDRLDDAYAAIQRGRQASEALGMVDTLASFHYELALVDMLRGRLDDALAELAIHYEYDQQTSAGWSVPAESVHSLIALHRGDLAGAEQHVDTAERAAADGAPRHRIELMVLARARLLDATGDREAALALVAAAFDEALRTGAAAHHPVIAPELARLAAATGNPERAVGTIAALQQLADLNPEVRSLRAAALQARGWLEPDAAALVQAANHMRDTGRSLEAALAAEHAAAGAATTQPDAARGLLHEARSAYEHSRATRDLARVEAALRALGAGRGVRGPRGRPSSGWDALTDTELTVVRLVSERLTNPEIAARLFISRRTVQTHVSHAFTKLGVSSRRELAAEAARHAGWRIRLEGLPEQVQQPEPPGKREAGTTIDPRDP
jgi:DNA-binding CsgD family transcriptional regulator/tetratricopeptide (TPR) repeat protein